MCLLVLAWKHHPRYRLILAGNRDEFHDRPAAPLNWWQDDPRILGGRDLKAGGTWLGVARSGRFGVVTNYRDLQAPVENAPSRGQLVPRFLTGATSPKEFLDDLRGAAPRYSGFNLLVGGTRALYYYSNRGPNPRALAPGVYGLSNHLLDTPWPKLARTRERFNALLSQQEIAPEDLFAMLADREQASGPDLPSTGLPEDWERVVVRAVHRQRALRHALLQRAAGGAHRSHDSSGTSLRCRRHPERQLPLRIHQHRSARGVVRSRGSRRDGGDRHFVRFLAGIA